MCGCQLDTHYVSDKLCGLLPRSEFVHWQQYSKAVVLSSVGLEHGGRVGAPVCVQAGAKDM